jgi:cholesterol transport system auxiliary component
VKTWIAMGKLVCLASVLLAMAACLNLNKSYPEKRSFVLEVSSENREPAPEATMVLKISKFRVSPLFVGRAMVYRIGELQYENDFYDEWFVSPGALLTQQFRDWLSKTGRFRLVLVGTNHIEPTHLLEGHVTEFYGDYRLAALPKAIFGIELLLLDGLNERQATFRRTYHKEVSLADRSPDALAGGLSQAVRLVLVDLERELSEVVVRQAPTSSSQLPSTHQ